MDPWGTKKSTNSGSITKMESITQVYKEGNKFTIFKTVIGYKILLPNKMAMLWLQVEEISYNLMNS